MNVQELTFKSDSPEATREMGVAIGQSLESGILLTLQGTLGAGKTNLVQAIGQGLGITETTVVSPTFTLIQVHQGRMPLVHIDAYRIADEDQYLELGIDEYFDGQHLVCMEWAEKFANILPEDRLAIEIEVTGDSQRVFQLRRIGNCESVSRLLEAMSERMPT